MRFPPNLFVSTYRTTQVLVACLLVQNIALAAIINPDDIPVKETGDAISAGEFNTVSNVLRGLIKDDNGTSSLADDRYGLFLPDGVAPTQPLDVNGTVKATYFLGDGSNLTNLPETHWVASGNDINYGTGRVGIGIANPSTLLEVKGGAIRATATNANSNYSELSHDGSNSALNFTGTGNLNFRRSGGDVMTLSQSGRLGIGTTNPQAELHVVGNIIANSISTGGGGGGPITSSQWEDVTGGITYNGGTVFMPGQVVVGDTTAKSNVYLEVAGAASDGVDGNGDMVGINLRADADLVAPVGQDIEFGTKDFGAGTYTEWATFNASGNFGIGTGAPQEKLHVAGQAEIPEVIFAQNNNGATDKSSIVGAGGVVQVFSDASIDFYESDANSRKFRFDVNNGRLGVGVTSPVDEIHVAGTVRADSFVDSAGNPIGGGLWTKNSGNDDIYYNAGSVGIGTTSPTVPLVVDGGSDASLSNGSGYIVVNGEGSANLVIDTNEIMARDNGAAANLYIQSGSGTTILGNGGGNVGINNNSPGHKLDVDGNIRSRTGRILYLGTADQRLYGDNDSALYQNSNNSSVTQTIYRDKENDVYGRIYGSTNGANFGLLDGDGNWFLQSAKDDNINFRVNNNEHMRILNSGNVGIGTSTPGVKLEVVGGQFSVRESGGPGVVTVKPSGNGSWWNMASIDNGTKFVVRTGNQTTANDTVADWNNSALTIQSDRNVGIGTLNPTQPLDVDGVIQHHNSIRSMGPNYGSNWMSFDEHQYGNSVILGAGGLTAIGAGESGNQVRNNVGENVESLYLAADGGIEFVTNLQSGWSSRVDAMDILSSGQVRLTGPRILGFGTAQQRFYGDNGSAMYLNSNNATTTQLIMRDSDNEVYGRLYGGSNGTQFGLIDGDGDWGLQMVKDGHTAFRINNDEKMRLDADSTLHLGSNHINAVEYNYNGTPTHGVKIRTNLPYVNSNQMTTLVIEGYNYGQQRTIGITLNWYIYGGNFYAMSASTHGGYAPIIKLANEGGNVVVFIDDRQYFNRFTVRAFGKGYTVDNDVSNYQGWTIVDQALTGTNQATFVYQNESGNQRLRTGRTLHFGTSDQRIYGDNGSAFYTNSNNSTTVQNIYRDKESTVYGRVYGTNNGGTFGLVDGDGDWGVRMEKDSYTSFRINNDEKMRILTNGNVGIGTDTPVDTLHVDGTIRADNFVNLAGEPITGLWVENGTAAHYPTGNVGINNTTPGHHLDVDGNIRTRVGRILYFGTADQRIYGDNDSAFYTSSNNSSVVQNIYRDKENTAYGRVYGSGNGSNFGLLDGDGNWFLQSVKDSYIGLRVNNNERMRIQSNGNVGIGTTAPGAKLEIAKVAPSSDEDAIRIGIDGETDGSINFFDDDATTTQNYRLTFNASTQDLRFHSDQTDNVLYLTETGNVGMNYSAPGHKLDVDGNIRTRIGRIMYFGTADQRIYGDNSSAFYKNSNHSTVTQTIYRDKENTVYGRVYGSGNGSNFGFLDGDGQWGIQMVKDNYTGFRVNNTERVRIQNNGNVGIGTTSAQERLHVEGTIRSGSAGATNGMTMLESVYSTTDSPNIIGSHYSSAATVIGYAVRPKSGQSGYVSSADNATWARGALEMTDTLRFLSAGGQTTAEGNDVSLTERLRINGSGLVGINNSGPSHHLDVDGNIRTRIGRSIYFGTTNNQSLTGDNSSALYIDSNHDSVVQTIYRDRQNTVYGRIYGDGDGANFGLLDNDGNWAIRHTTDDSTRWYVNNSQRMHLSSSGNLGIGMSGASSRLEVAGDIEFSGTIKTSSGEVRCPTDRVMVGFNTSGIICEFPPQLYQ